MSDDVVRRYHGARPMQAPAKLLDDAIREVEILREENARLREALKPFAEMQLWTDAYPDGPLSATSEKRFVDPLWIVAARAAIREGGTGNENNA